MPEALAWFPNPAKVSPYDACPCSEPTTGAYGVAIVGTRHPTPYGLGMAERLACDLAVRRAGLFSRPGSQRRRCRPSRRHQRQRENGGGGYYLSQENTRLAEQMLALAP
jgi:hypothetical protein